MCGIAGIISPRPTQDQALSAFLKTLRHRGPDDDGIYLSLDRTVGLAHTRLSILDLSAAGHQPMSDETAALWITYNGEIYNFRELRKELEAKGHRFRSQTDTEVILCGYAQWGLDVLERLRGMYAFGLWDASKKRLILARDPFGIKPLYYASTQDALIFASEARAVLDSGFISRRISWEGLLSYLSFGSVETPLTFLQEIRSLAPGEVLTADLQEEKLRITIEKPAQATLSTLPGGWMPPSGRPADRTQNVRHLREILEESVRAHLVSDVPVGAFLSGGIDSSAIVALMSRVSPAKPRTFTVIFREQEFSEALYARAVAKRFDTTHQEILLSQEQLLQLLPAALEAMDQPTMDGINTYVVSKAVREAGIAVALSGLGGDELFGGYPSFARARLVQRFKLPQPARRLLAGAISATATASTRMKKLAELLASGPSPLTIYLASRGVFSQSDRASLCPTLPTQAALLPPLSENLPDQDPFLSICLYEMRHYMVNTLLRDTDCMSMAHALEVRVPFVDRDLVRAVLEIPSSHKVDGKRPKPLLLDALGEELPEEIWRRPKAGFTLPFERWIQSRLRPEIEVVFADEQGWKSLGISPKAAQTVWKQFLRNPRGVGWSRPWTLYVLARWSRLHSLSF